MLKPGVPHGCCEVARHSGPTDDAAFRMKLRADMFDVVKEQQKLLHEWAKQWECQRGEQLDRHLGALVGEIQKLREELPETLLKIGKDKLYLTPLHNNTNFEKPPDIIVEQSPMDGGQAARAGAVVQPRTLESKQSGESQQRRRDRHFFRRHFYKEKVLASRTMSDENNLSPTTAETNGLGVHLRRLQRRQKNRFEMRQMGLTAEARHHGLTGCLVKFVESSPFTTICAVLIILNTIFLGYEADTSVGRAFEEPARDLPDWFTHVTRGFTCAFAIELILRIAAFRLTFFTGLECRWNVFDFVVVLCSVAEEFLMRFQGFSPLRVLRALRLVRTLRLIRVVRFFRSLRMMVLCIFNGMMQLAWALVLLFGLITLFSIVCLQGVSVHLLDHSPGPSGGGGGAGADDLLQGDDLNYPDLREALYLNYRSLWRTSVAMLMSVSGGMDWYDVMQPLAVISRWYLLLFILFVVFVVFGVLNVITGLFVEQALQVRDRDLVVQAEMESIDRFLVDMQDIFTEADADLSGVITREELDRFLSQDRVLAYMSTHQLDVSDLSTMFRLLDQDNTGEIEIEEWLLGCLRLKGQAKCLDIMRLFECMDTFQVQLSDIEAKIGIEAVRHQQEQIFPTTPGLSPGRSPW